MDLKRHNITVSSGFFVLLVIAGLLFPLQWVVAWIIASVIHECGHFIALRICNVSWSSMKIRPHGFQINVDTMTPIKEVICAAGGPLIGLAPLAFARMVPRTAVCALIQTVCNLLPLSSLDGSRILSGILHGFLSDRRAVQVSLILERAFIILIGFLTLCMSLFGFYGIFPLIILTLILIKIIRIKFPCKRSGIRVQ